ncbi:MAG: DUF4421 domain-containing protein [Prevotella sp.]|nr:DUF4421 domain-containing protein [Prevotella sp.]
MLRLLLSVLFSVFVAFSACGQEIVVADSLAALTTQADSLAALTTQADSTTVEPQKKHKKTREEMSFWDKVYEEVKKFSRVDKRYIEPQHYNYTVMLQNTNTYESYTISDKAGHEIVLSPEPSFKFGPYIGWRWLVLGYTIDFSHLGDGHNKQDFDISLYSNQVGVDLFYRKTGNDYKIRRLTLGENMNTSTFRNVPFSGFNASIKGFNFYYIWNHNRFSYPAAFNQSTCQKISCGSPLIGIGYTQHKLNIDAVNLKNLIMSKLDIDMSAITVDTTLVATKVNYTDLSVSAGYAYNWVFAKDWLFAVSLSLALGHRRSTGDMEREKISLREFSFRNFNLDGVGRFGLVWNNTRWYAGMSTILHSYSYRKSHFSTNSVFGSVNIYFGLNFGDR